MNGAGPSLAILGVAMVVALGLTIRRDWRSGADLRSAAWLVAVTLVAQALHFGEELATGFELRFPALFGLGPMSNGFFVSFNVGWLAIWMLAGWGLARRFRPALFPLWFLAIGSAMNGIAHPLLALRAGGYFPGLVTSPLVGVAGFLLLRRLATITRPPES